jgi:hypothetical protein
MKDKLFVFGILALIALGWYGIKPPSDEKMIATFQANRSEFEQLVEMYITDDQDMWISNGVMYWVGTSTSDGVSGERQLEYKTLLNRVGLSSIGVGSVRNYNGPHQTIPFGYSAYLQLPNAPVKSFMYTENKITLPITTGNTHAYKFQDDESFRKVCRQIEEAWYICIDYED